MANRYKDFSEFLKKANLDGKQTFTLTVDEIKKNNGGYLPASAEQFQAFWSNYKRYWLEAGYETRNVLRPDDKGNLTVTFYKVSDLKNLEEAENQMTT